MATVILHKDFERINKENEMNNIVTDVISIRKLVDGYWGVENLHNIVPARSMFKLARSYGYEEAPVMHLEIFFDLGEFEELPEEAAMLAYYMTCLFSRDFQCVYALHEDGGRLRVHILVNTICMHDGHIMYMNEMVAAGILRTPPWNDSRTAEVRHLDRLKQTPLPSIRQLAKLAWRPA